MGVLTEIVNAYCYVVPPFDTDCTNSTGSGTPYGTTDCTITNDGAGDWTVTLPFGTNGFGVPDAVLTFASNASTPKTIGFVNLGGR